MNLYDSGIRLPIRFGFLKHIAEWTPTRSQPDWWRALKRRGFRFLWPEVNPDGIPFIVVTSGVCKMYLEIPRGSMNGWLLERMDDGSWSLDRKATMRDCLAIHDAYGDLVRPYPDRPDPRPIAMVSYL